MMSTKRFAMMMISDVRTVIPITTEKSRLKTELMKYLPMPGIEKMISMMNVPVMMSPILNGPRADGEWFSDRPIPEITGTNTTDPELLGIPKGERK